MAEIEGINTPLNHQTLLEELVFWTVKFEFPQKIVTLLLSILPDEQYKVSVELLVITYNRLWLEKRIRK